MNFLQENNIYCGNSINLLTKIKPSCVSLSFWSPPYFLGKDYEKDMSFDSWQNLLNNVIKLHKDIIKPGGFLVINIADIISFKDENMPKIMGKNPSNRKCPITKEMIIETQIKNPDANRYDLAKILNCSEQTIDRRLHGNNIRGGKYETGTHIKLIGWYLEKYAYENGLYLYDKRIWKKDPAWANSKWTNNTLKAVSETEDLYIFWKPGEYTVNRDRLTPDEWKEWGKRQIWEINSVRQNYPHPAMFPLELATRVIKLYSDNGELIIDPFMGSGTTVEAAIKLNRKFIGIEIMREYYNLAAKKIKLLKENLLYQNSIFNIVD